MRFNIAGDRLGFVTGNVDYMTIFNRTGWRSPLERKTCTLFWFIVSSPHGALFHLDPYLNISQLYLDVWTKI